MAFKRMEGFSGSIPQRFIDNNMKVCPICGSSNPHWALDMKRQMKMEGNLYLFQCEQCKGVLSSPVADVAGFNKTALTTTGFLKKMSGKQNGVIYMKVYDTGQSQDTAEICGKEFTLQELIQMAEEKCTDPVKDKKYY